MMFPNSSMTTAATSAATAAAPADAAQTSDLWVRVESRSQPGCFYWTTTDGLRSQWTRPAARKILPPTNVAGNLGPGAQIPVQVPLYPVKRRSYGHESVKPFQVVVESDYDPDIFNYLDIKAGETIIVIGKMKNDINVTWLYGYKFGSSPKYAGKFPTHFLSSRIYSDSEPSWMKKLDHRFLYPLHATAKRGDVNAMTRFLDGGAEIDQADKDGRTPLYVACKNGHVDAARLLLDNGAEVDRAASWGRTPLYIAKENGHSAVVALLKKHSRSSGVCMVC